MSGKPRERAPGSEDPAAAGETDRQPATAEEDRPLNAPQWQELADAVWLAAHWSLAGRIGPGPSGLMDGEAPDDEAPSPTVPPFDTRPQPAADEPDSSTPAAAQPSFASQEPIQLLVESPLLPRARSAEAPTAARRSAQLARSLHRLRRRMPSRHQLQFDEEATAEQMFTDGLWMPLLRPSEARAFELVVLIDDSPTMSIWHQETTALLSAAEHSGSFGSVRTVRLDLPNDASGSPTLRWSATQSFTDPGEMLSGRAGQLFLIVTDGLAHGWVGSGADDLLARLGHAGPTALVSLLPPHLRHRSSLYPHNAVLEAAGFGAANRNLSYGPSPGGLDPLRPLPQAGEDRVVVPVLSLKPESLAAWAGLVVGERGVRRALPVVVAGALSEGNPTPGLIAPRVHSAAPAAVRRFFRLATPSARLLATQLAAAPFEFDLIQQLRSRIMPDTGAEHLAEIMMGGLIDWDDNGARHPEFADGVRQALLAMTTRKQLARVVGIVGELPAAGAQGAALRAALRDPTQAALPDPDKGGWWQTELAVMRALGGPYSHRARRIQNTVAPSAGDAPGGLADQVRLEQPRPDSAPHPVTSAAPAAAEVTALGPVPAGHLASPPVMLNIPPRNPQFTGRQEQLQALAQRLAAGGTVCVLPDALHGDVAGTSELALEYIHRHVGDYDLLCWIPARQESLILEAFAKLTAELGIGTSDSSPLPVDAAVSAAHEALRTDTDRRWLLVFDDAQDVETVRRYLPRGGQGGVLVTSRDRRWAQVSDTIGLDVLERKDSVALLQAQASTLSVQDADRLAESLHDLPLAVEQAGAWLRDTHLPAHVYIELIEERARDADVLAVQLRCRPALIAAWEITLERLRQTNPAALKLLDLCATMACEPIPRALLTRQILADAGTQDLGPLDDPVAVGRALRALRQAFLIKLDHRADTLQLHRALRDLILARLTSEQREQQRETVHQLLVAARPGHHVDAQEWPAYWLLLPHLLASQALTSTDSRVRDLVHDTVLFLQHRGDRNGATALAEQAGAAWLAASGEEHREVSRMTKTNAMLLRQAGRIAESVPLTERALEISRRTAMASDDLIDSLCELADARRHQGRFQQAQDLSKEATRLARYHFGDEDPLTLRATHSWTTDLRLRGLFTQALPLDQENAHRCELLLQPADSRTLHSLNAVAVDMRESGDYSGARDLQERLYLSAESELGEKHPLTLDAARHLAGCRRRDGAFAGAALLSAKTLRHSTTRYGPDHPASLAAAVDAAIDLRLAGNLGQSRLLSETTAQRLAARLGEDHLCTLVAQTGLAITMRAFGDLDLAREIEDSVAGRLKVTVGHRHTTTLIVEIGRACTAYVELDFDRAREIDQRNLSLLDAVVGEQHPLRSSCAANLALDLRGLGRGAEADALQHTAIEGLASALRAGHAWLTAARTGRRIDCDPVYVSL